jgi:hypothetical protein
MEPRHGVRFTSPEGARVTVLVDGEFRASDVTVCVGGRTLSAGNATVERVATRHGAVFSEAVATLLAKHAAIVREACDGAMRYDGALVCDALDAVECEVREKCGPEDREACAQMIVARAMIPTVVP